MSLTAIYHGGPFDGRREVIGEQFGKAPLERRFIGSLPDLDPATPPPVEPIYSPLPEGRYALVSVGTIPLQQTAATTEVLAHYDWRGWM